MIVNILNDRVVWRVLLFISYSKGRGYKFSDLKESLNLNNSSLYKVLDKLEFYNIIKKENSIYKINFMNPKSDILFSIIEEDKLVFNNIGSNAIEIVIDFMSKVDKFTSIKQIYLFGSYAKRTSTKNSDIDLAIILKEPLDLFEYSYSIQEKYGKKIEIHYFLENEFKNTSSKLIEEIKRDGIKLL